MSDPQDDPTSELPPPPSGAPTDPPPPGAPPPPPGAPESAAPPAAPVPPPPPGSPIPGAVPPSAAAAPFGGAPDPHGLGASALRLSGGARKNGRAALAVLSVVLEEGEMVEEVLVGKYLGIDGAAALVTGYLVLVNAREWQPEVVRVPVVGLGVQGMQDGRTASLHFTSGATEDRFEGVSDTALAVEFANRIRQRAAGG